MSDASLARLTPHALAALRIVTGLLFLFHGLVKLFGFPAVEGMGRVELFSLFGLGGVIELVGGGLVMLGLFTRPAAFIASGEMAIAYWMFHAPGSLYPIVNGGDPAILYCFIFLYLAVAGPGSFSLDGLLRSRSVAQTPASA
jgi:putative oxidoreductase